jgi:hypothetical protein
VFSRDHCAKINDVFLWVFVRKGEKMKKIIKSKINQVQVVKVFALKKVYNFLDFVVSVSFFSLGHVEKEQKLLFSKKSVTSDAQKPLRNAFF